MMKAADVTATNVISNYNQTKTPCITPKRAKS